MKKLNKLKINPDKLMKNEELVELKGGYGGGSGGGSLRCYQWGSMNGCGGSFVYFNAPCWGALDVCLALGGSCVVC